MQIFEAEIQFNRTEQIKLPYWYFYLVFYEFKYSYCFFAIPDNQ